MVSSPRLRRRSISRQEVGGHGCSRTIVYSRLSCVFLPRVDRKPRDLCSAARDSSARDVVRPDQDFAGGVALVATAYVVGVLLSGVSESLVRLYTRVSPTQDPRLLVSRPECSVPMLQALRTIAPNVGTSEGTLGLTEYFLCSALVREYLPSVASEIERELAVARMRESLLAVVVLWTTVGLAWGTKVFASGRPRTGVAMFLGSLCSGIALTISLISLLQQNRRREARQTCTSFLMGHSVGAFGVGNSLGAVANARRHNETR